MSMSCHPRLWSHATVTYGPKTWMPAIGAGMTSGDVGPPIRAFRQEGKPDFRPASWTGSDAWGVRRSAALAQALGGECHDLTPRRRLRRLQHALRKLLGDAQKPLAAIHLGPDVLGMNAGRNPEHHEIVHQIGAFTDDRRGISVHRVDHDFDRFLGHLLGHLAATSPQQPRRPRRGGIAIAGCLHGLIEAVERISHARPYRDCDESILIEGFGEPALARARQSGRGNKPLLARLASGE